MNVRISLPPLDRWGLPCLLFVALLLRLAVISEQPAELTTDRDVYLGIATGLAEGRGYSSPGSRQPTAYRPPLYPLVIAAGLNIFPPAIVIAGINLLATAVAVWTTERIGAQLQLGRSRFLAAALVAFDPLLIQYSRQPMTETVCMMLAALWLWSSISQFRDLQGTPVQSGLLSGLIMGLLVLCRPTFWPLAGAWCVCLLFPGIVSLRTVTNRNLSDLKIRMGSVLSTVAALALVVAPWLVRNGMMLGVPVLTTTHGGYTLLLSNNPVFYQEVVRQPWGTVWQNDSLERWQRANEEKLQQDLRAGSSEIEKDRWYSQQAWRNIAADPSGFVRSIGHRIRSLWNTVPQSDAAAEAGQRLVAVIGWYYGLILTAGLLGMVLVTQRDNRRSWWPVYLLLATVQFAHLFYWTNARMRAPLVPVVALFAAAAATRLLEHRPE